MDLCHIFHCPEKIMLVQSTLTLRNHPVAFEMGGFTILSFHIWGCAGRCTLLVSFVLVQDEHGKPFGMVLPYSASLGISSFWCLSSILGNLTPRFCTIYPFSHSSSKNLILQSLLLSTLIQQTCIKCLHYARHYSKWPGHPANRTPEPLSLYALHRDKQETDIKQGNDGYDRW